MERVIAGEAKHSGKLTRAHLKHVITIMRDLIKEGHRIVDVRFEIPEGRSTKIVLVYDIPEDLIIPYTGAQGVEVTANEPDTKRDGSVREDK